MGKIACHVRGHFVAYLALFFALGGTSIAAVNAVPRNSVGTTQLKKNAVTTPKIKNGAVTGAKIKLSTLGKVPAAANADHATSADNATNATNATNAAHASNADKATSAGDAGTLAGQPPSAYLDRCPSGTVLVAGECFESTTRPPAALTTAMSNCAASGRRLPTGGELAAYGNAYGMTAGEWADSLYFAVVTMGGSPKFEGMGYQFLQGGGSGIGPVDETTLLPYRCVTGYTT
jgi:hypothetical protein